MIDFDPVFRGEQRALDLVTGLSPADLRRETTELISAILSLVTACGDADVVFVPRDPDANDAAAAHASETNIPWTLGHVIVHVTAGCEETAFLGAELARGVPFHGRSRFEVPWEQVMTIAQVRERLEESQRMCLACLDIWPAQPNLDLTHEVWPGGPVVNALGYHLIGTSHGFGHLPQLAEIIRQSRAA